MILTANYLMYRFATTEFERKVHRSKLIQGFYSKRKSIEKKHTESKFQKSLNEASIKYISSLQYQIFRSGIGFILAMNYLVWPFLSSGSFDTVGALILIAYIGLTDPYFKFSLTNIVIEKIKTNRQQKKMIEVFELFDLLKSDLYSLQKNQPINIYNILKDNADNFDFIKVSIIKMLNVWKTSPEKSKEILFQDVGGDSTKALGEIIFKLDHLSKDNAINLMQQEQGSFSTQYYEVIKRIAQTRKSQIYMFGFISIFSVLIWLMVYFYLSVQDVMNINVNF